jgi:tripartite-type tricarboxylate transporter receptor subunit TctC
MKAFKLLCAMAALFATPIGTNAQDYPSRPVKIIVGFPAGTSTDIIARIYANELSMKLKQPFVVENVSGAASNRAAAMVAQSTADGYTLLMGTIANSISQSVYKNLPYNLEANLDPITMVGNAPTVLIANENIEAYSVAELVALSKTKGPLLYASAGVGTAPHLMAELLAQTTGAQLSHIPYKGNTEAMADLLGARIALIFAPIPTVAGLIKQKQVRALAVTSAKRSPSAPDVPTMSEQGLKGFDTGIWYGLFAPKGTPAEIVDQLAARTNEATGNAAVKERLIQNGADPETSSPAAFAAFIHDDIAKWRKIVESRGIFIE